MFKAIKRVFTFVQDCQVAKSMQLGGGLNLRFTEDMINDKGYILIENKHYLRAHGVILAGCVTVGFNNPCDPFNLKKVPCVIVDDEFYKLSKGTQEFIIQHELGHFHNGDNESTNGRMLIVEKNADKYALDQVGQVTAINALIEMKKALKFIGNTKEIDKRIDHLAKYWTRH